MKKLIHPNLSKEENLLTQVRKMSRVLMISGIAESRAPSGIVR
jgi:hypothetical protein